MMKIRLNGEENDVHAVTVNDLVENKGLDPEKIVIEKNYEIIPRDRWPGTRIEENDHIEVISFVGGG